MAITVLFHNLTDFALIKLTILTNFISLLLKFGACRQWYNKIPTVSSCNRSLNLSFFALSQLMELTTFNSHYIFLTSKIHSTSAR